jgi:hypothetical protein
VQLSKLDGAVEALRKNRTRVLDAVGNVHGLAVRRSADPEGELATQLVFLLAPSPDGPPVSRRRAKEAGMGCGNFSRTTRGTMPATGTRCGTVRPTAVSVVPTTALSRKACPSIAPTNGPDPGNSQPAAVFGIDIVMSDEKIESMAKAIAAGARAATVAIGRTEWGPLPFHVPVLRGSTSGGMRRHETPPRCDRPPQRRHTRTPSPEPGVAHCFPVRREFPSSRWKSLVFRVRRLWILKIAPHFSHGGERPRLGGRAPAPAHLATVLAERDLFPANFWRAVRRHPERSRWRVLFGGNRAPTKTKTKWT